MVERGTRRVGWASVATGFGGLTTRAVSVPAVLALRAALVLAVAEVHGQLDDPDLKGHLALVLGGDDATAALRKHGFAPADGLTRNWVDRAPER